ncbi:glutaredoxin family protein [Kineococcus sp. NPDC059986]|uniref:glutaredoxin family protein n=1 Tax=Kineococcus sp. NPDC059986 TaxID=3155538 RepID=UPI003450A411
MDHAERTTGVGEARVVLVSRVGCHLCDDGREVVRTVAEAAGVSWTEVDVDADPDLLRRFTDKVPVVLVDGAEKDFGRLDAVRLRQALAGKRWWRRSPRLR